MGSLKLDTVLAAWATVVKLATQLSTTPSSKTCLPTVPLNSLTELVQSSCLTNRKFTKTSHKTNLSSMWRICSMWLTMGPLKSTPNTPATTPVPKSKTFQTPSQLARTASKKATSCCLNREEGLEVNSREAAASCQMSKDSSMARHLRTRDLVRHLRI